MAGYNVTRFTRDVPESRRKHGKREENRDLIARLKELKELKEKKAALITAVKNKNKDAFFYDYYSVNKNLVKKNQITLEELRRKKKYVESEIKRCEKKMQTEGCPKRMSQHIKFQEDGTAIHKELLEDPAENHMLEYEEYIAELKSKLAVIVIAINKKSSQGK